jgi:hypothetical protein
VISVSAVLREMVAVPVAVLEVTGTSWLPASEATPQNEAIVIGMELLQGPEPAASVERTM